MSRSTALSLRRHAAGAGGLVTVTALVAMMIYLFHHSQRWNAEFTALFGEKAGSNGSGGTPESKSEFIDQSRRLAFLSYSSEWRVAFVHGHSATPIFLDVSRVGEFPVDDVVLRPSDGLLKGMAAKCGRTEAVEKGAMFYFTLGSRRPRTQ